MPGLRSTLWLLLVFAPTAVRGHPNQVRTHAPDVFAAVRELVADLGPVERPALLNLLSHPLSVRHFPQLVWSLHGTRRLPGFGNAISELMALAAEHDRQDKGPLSQQKMKRDGSQDNVPAAVHFWAKGFEFQALATLRDLGFPVSDFGHRAERGRNDHRAVTAWDGEINAGRRKLVEVKLFGNARATAAENNARFKELGQQLARQSRYSGGGFVVVLGHTQAKVPLWDFGRLTRALHQPVEVIALHEPSGSRQRIYPKIEEGQFGSAFGAMKAQRQNVSFLTPAWWANFLAGLPGERVAPTRPTPRRAPVRIRDVRVVGAQ